MTDPEKRAIILTGVFLLTIGLFLQAQGRSQTTCSPAMARQAETESSQLRSWASIYRSFKHFRTCDKGVVAEGYSTSVSHMLAQHWDRLDDLMPLMKSDRGFEEFVSRHIDETMTEHEAYIIIENSRHHCPTGAKRLCFMITGD